MRKCYNQHLIQRIPATSMAIRKRLANHTRLLQHPNKANPNMSCQQETISYIPHSESPRYIPSGFLLPLKSDGLHEMLMIYVPSPKFSSLVEELQSLRSEMNDLKKKTSKEKN